MAVSDGQVMVHYRASEGNQWFTNKAIAMVDHWWLAMASEGSISG